MARGATRENGKARSQSVYKLDAISGGLDIRFELRGRMWRLPSDPDVEQVALMLQLERKIKGEEATDQTDIAQAIVDAKTLVVDLLGECDQEQEVPEKFRIGVGEILTLFALITGGPTVADAVAEGITAGMSGARGLEDLSEEERDLIAEGDADAAPLVSKSRSSGRRSSSSASTSGRRSGGGA